MKTQRSSTVARFKQAHGLRPNEIEAGRTVPARWDDTQLVETWEARKARRAAERAGGAA